MAEKRTTADGSGPWWVGPWWVFAMLSGIWIVAAGLLLSYDRNGVGVVAVISGSALIGLGALCAPHRSAATPVQKACDQVGQQLARGSAPMTEKAEVVGRIVDREVERKALIEGLNSTPPRIRLTHGHVAAIGRFEREERMAKRSRKRGRRAP